MTTGVLLAALLCCITACEPAQKATGPAEEPRTTGEQPSTTSPAPQEQTELREMMAVAERWARLDAGFTLSQRVTAGIATVRRWVRDIGLGETTVELVGTRTGYPAFAVESADGTRLVLVDGEAIYQGVDGFSWFRRVHSRRSAAAWAAAWLLLVEQVAREPLDSTTRPSAPPPRWHGDELKFAFRKNSTEISQLRIRIPAGEAETPEVVTRGPLQTNR